MLDAMVQDLERATGPWHAEWMAIPESFVLTAGALNQAKFVLAGLEVDAARMRQNLDLTNGLVVSEAVMMGLAPYLGREHAHDLVYDLCRDAVKHNRPLLDLLAANAEITKHVDRRKLAELCDPANYLGLSGVMVDRVLASL
jgi:3-carboxy-cis,cis-muconate cycloisomerase